MQKYLITHKNCYDGMASSWVFTKKFGWGNFGIYFDPRDNSWVNKTPLFNNNVSPFDVYFCDFAPSAENYISLLKRGHSVTILDHHASAIENFERANISGNNIIFDVNECGATIAYKKYFDNNIPDILKAIRRGDLWKFEGDDDLSINSYLKSVLSPNSGFEKFEEQLNKWDNNIALLEGKAIRRREELDVNFLCSKASILIIGGEEIISLNSQILQSEIGNKLSLLSKNDLALIYFLDQISGDVCFSVRGNRAKEFAEKMGGGGHPKAAGFKMKLDKFVEIYNKSKNFN